MDYLRIGYIKKVHGLKGELKVLPLTDTPKRFKKVKSFYVCTETEINEYELEYASITAKDVIIKIAGVNSIDDAQKFINKYVAIDRKFGVELSEWEFYTQDLIGCTVEYNGKKIGTVVDVSNYGANSNMLIETEDKKEVYYPFVRDFISNVDIENKNICINQVEDFFDI